MSRFVTTLKTDQTDRRTYTLLDDLVLADEELFAITVPRGFQADFASIKVLHNAFCSFYSPWCRATVTTPRRFMTGCTLAGR